VLGIPYRSLVCSGLKQLCIQVSVCNEAAFRFLY
jgi:hypothetical protein